MCHTPGNGSALDVLGAYNTKHEQCSSWLPDALAEYERGSVNGSYNHDQYGRVCGISGEDPLLSSPSGSGVLERI